MQNNFKIIEIGTFFKEKAPPPSVFKIPKLKLGHFWISLSQIFSIFYFDASPYYKVSFSIISYPTPPRQNCFFVVTLKFIKHVCQQPNPLSQREANSPHLTLLLTAPSLPKWYHLHSTW